MSTSMLGPVKCQHRWKTGPEISYPSRLPSLAPNDEDKGRDLGIETGVCRRCGAARLRFFSLEHDWAVSGWGYAASMKELILGRPLDEFETKKMLLNVVLN